MSTDLKEFGNLSYKRRPLNIAVDTLVSLASPDPNGQHILSLIEDCCQKLHSTQQKFRFISKHHNTQQMKKINI
jgi:hypothetical protein